MASLTYTLGPQSRTFTLSAGDVTRTLNAMKTRYGQITENGTPRDRTNAELFDMWTLENMRTLKQIVADEERRIAAAAVAKIAVA